MKFLGFEINKQKQPAKASVIRRESFESYTAPKISEDKRNDWVSFGEKNDFPQYLNDLLYASPIHNAIVNSVATMMNGSEFSYVVKDGSEFVPTDAMQKVLLDNFTNSINRSEFYLKDLKYKVGFSLKHHGRFALECIWAADFSRLTEINFVDVSLVRSGKRNAKGTIEHYYVCKDWSNTRQNPPIRYDAYSRNTKNKNVQLYVYDRFGAGMDYYGLPDYVSAIPYCDLDGEIANFHKSAIKNGFAPSYIITEFGNFENEAERQAYVRNLKRNYKGSSEAGEVFIAFADSKENAPEIRAIETSNLDKQYLNLADTVIQEILSAHRVTSPMLLGIPTGARLGYSNELQNAYYIFEKTVIEPYREIVNRVFSELLSDWGVKGVSVVSKSLNPFAVEVKEEEPLISSIGAEGVQALQSIMADESLTIQQKGGLLVSVFGMTKEQVNEILL
jgi:hypothetical protein